MINFDYVIKWENKMKDIKDNKTLDLAIESTKVKSAGRPKISTLTRKLQVAAAQKRFRLSVKEAQEKKLSIFYGIHADSKDAVKYLKTQSELLSKRADSFSSKDSDREVSEMINHLIFLLERTRSENGIDS